MEEAGPAPSTLQGPLGYSRRPWYLQAGAQALWARTHSGTRGKATRCGSGRPLSAVPCTPFPSSQLGPFRVIGNSVHSTRLRPHELPFFPASLPPSFPPSSTLLPTHTPLPPSPHTPPPPFLPAPLPPTPVHPTDEPW